MNILEYIDYLMDQGYSEEEAYLFADVTYNLAYDVEDYYGGK